MQINPKNLNAAVRIAAINENVYISKIGAMMNKKKVLFVCIHNSARSQMAEAFLNKLGGDIFETESAGIEKGVLNPLAIQVMKEAGIDISGNLTKEVGSFYKLGKQYDFVITVCDDASAENCLVFPGITKRLHWSFADPSQFEGTLESKLEKTRKVRDEIKD
jgi:arsenate reductase